MITIDVPCQKCKNFTGLNKYMMCCKAFPKGIKIDIMKVDVTKLKECANGYKFEPKND